MSRSSVKRVTRSKQNLAPRSQFTYKLAQGHQHLCHWTLLSFPSQLAGEADVAAIHTVSVMQCRPHLAIEQRGTIVAKPNHLVTDGRQSDSTPSPPFVLRQTSRSLGPRFASFDSARDATMLPQDNPTNCPCQPRNSLELSVCCTLVATTALSTKAFLAVE